MSEEEGSNFGCIVSCIEEDEGVPVILQMINELVGTPALSGEDITCGAPITWEVDNKYYNTEVQFVVCTSGNVSKELERADREYEALVMVCNLDERDVCESLSRTWAQVEPQDGGGSPAICLVIGTTKGVESSNHGNVLSWCVKRGCELIEWEREKVTAKQDENDSESDDGYPAEAVGVARLAEALQAHAWSHMTMKRDPTLRVQKATKNESEKLATGDTPPEADATNQNSESSHVTECSGGVPGLKELEEKAMATSLTSKEETQRRVDSLLSPEDEQLIAMGLQDGGNDDKDPGGESFENLFGRLAHMKQHAESLPHEERKAYAEQVVMAFWNAIGGDEDEVKSEQDD